MLHWNSIWHSFSHILWHSIRHSFSHSIWHLFWHSFWHTILTFFLASILHSTWHLRRHSTTAFYLAFRLTSILTFFLASSSGILSVRVQAQPTASGTCDMRFGSSRSPPRVRSYQFRRQAGTEVDEKRRRGEEGGWVAPLLNSRDPHLAGGENTETWQAFRLFASMEISLPTIHVKTSLNIGWCVFFKVLGFEALQKISHHFVG